MRCSRLGGLLTAGLLSMVGCAGVAAHEPATAAAMAEAPAPPPLDRSLFARDAAGGVSEDDLQRVLASTLELELPLRLGVVALDDAFRAEAQAPVTEQGMVAEEVTQALKASRHFSHVTDVSTDLPNPAGVEGLRTIAARYRTRYLLLCSVQKEDQSHLNNWAWLYPTVVGLFAAPGLTVSTEGMMQGSLLDVRTGTVLYTVREPFRTSSVSWLIGAERQHRAVDAQAARAAAQRLAGLVLAQTDELASWVQRENRVRVSGGAARVGEDTRSAASD